MAWSPGVEEGRFYGMIQQEVFFCQPVGCAEERGTSVAYCRREALYVLQILFILLKKSGQDKQDGRDENPKKKSNQSVFGE
jgi:hypothetical protein